MNPFAPVSRRGDQFRGAVVSRRGVGMAALAVAGLGVAGCKDGGETTTTPTAVTSQNTVLTTPKPSGSAATPTASGSMVPAKTINNLDPITVKGEYGKAPTVTAQWPLAISKTQSKAVIPGKGSAVTKGGTVLVNYTGLNARTGKVFDTSFKKGGKPVAFPLSQVIKGFQTGLEGQKIGSRVLIMMTAKDGYADGNPQAGIMKGDNLVFVVDIVSAQLQQPEGTPVKPPAGLPTVKDNGKGKAPTISLSGATMPTKLTIQPLIKGDGPTVKATDGVVVNYTAMDWKSGKVVAENYTTGPEAGMLNTLIPGWQKGLVNQTVGSRVLLVVPPADAYPKGNATPSIPAGATLVYVVDILFASAT